MLIGIVPLAFLIYFSVQLYRQKSEKITLLKDFVDRIEQSGYISKLIIELQKERKLSFDYAIKKDSATELKPQRVVTDAALKKIESEQTLVLKDFKSYTFLNNLAGIRTQVDNHTADPNAVVHNYTTMVYRLNTLNAISPSSETYLKPVYAELVSQKLLHEMLTNLRIIQSNIFTVLYTRKYMVETLVGTIGVYQVYKTYETEFLVKSSSQTKAQYEKLKSDPNLKATLQYMDTLFATFNFGDKYTADEWWSLSDRSLLQIRAFQAEIWNTATDGMNKMVESEKASRTMMLIYLIAAIVLAGYFVLYIIRSITQTLSELEGAAKRISKGATGVGINIHSNDAIGSLAQSIYSIDETNKQLADAASAIGKGNFHVPVKPRSEDDVLGHAVVRMQSELQNFTQKLEESREQFRQLADFMPQIAWTATADGKVDYYNKRWFDFTGFSKTGEQNWTLILHPDDVQRCLSAWRKSVETGEPYEIEYRFKDRTNRYKWFLGKAMPIRDDAGNVVKWFGTSTEIHHQKTLSAELEQKVRERTKDLNEANVELERSNKDLEQFAYIASHDLQEPIRKIGIFSQYIRNNAYEKMDDSSRNYLDKIVTSTERMRNIIKDLLDFSHINQMKDEFEKVDLNTIIEDVKSDLELLIQQKQAVINIDQLPVIQAIPVQMNQLFYNLVNNALKFTAEGIYPVIDITVKELSKDEIPDQLERSKKYFQVKVQDNGIGFNQGYADKIFNMFQRLSKSYAGTGIGLAICKKIAESHKGTISASSQPGQGATFIITLPETH